MNGAPASAPRWQHLAATMAVVGSVFTGCGGGSPLLHSVRALPRGEVRAAAGFSSNIALGAHAAALRDARSLAATAPSVPGLPGSNEPYARGALVAASVAPGAAPFVGARVGLGDAYEAGLAYTGRGARADARRSFEIPGQKGISASVGLGGSAVFYGRAQSSLLPAVDLTSVHGVGADIPLLLGWESDAGIYRAWVGGRVGFEYAKIETLTSEPKSGSLVPTPIALTGTRVFGGGVVGLAVGFRRVHVAMELNVAYQAVSGSYNGTSSSISGLTAAPATALWVGF